MWDRTRQYLRKIGTVILLGVIIIWALEYFPRELSGGKESLTTLFTDSLNDEAIHQAEPLHQEAVPQQNKNDLRLSLTQEASPESERERESLRMAGSYLGQLGKTIQPLMAPLGFDWKMSVSLLAGLPAKEIIISTLGVMYQSGVEESTVNLRQKLRNEVHDSGRLKGTPVFSTASALAFLVFILIYFPCIGVVAAIRNESGSWKWGLFSIVYTTTLAWLLAFITYQGASLLIR